MSDTLERILAQTRDLVERRARDWPVERFAARIRAQTPPRGFARALKRATAEQVPGLIAEIKRASPSAGIIRPVFDPCAIARDYAAAGATCLSVLTEEAHFHGKARDLERARDTVDLPVLRKDFIVTPWQVHESRAMGADCILLIMAALDNDTALALTGLAHSLELDVLVEVHDEAELDRALGLDTALIGLNNRDLRTLRTDLAVTERLAPLVPPDRVVVSESGIRVEADLRRLRASGASCFLVGESLLRAADVAAATRALLGRAA